MLVLPAATLVAVMLAHTARQTRAGMIQVLESNYIRTAVLKGLRWRTVVVKHALRNALLPAITVIALNVGWLVGGLIIVENVFSYPGIGKLLLEAVENRDVPLLQGVAMLIALIYAGSESARRSALRTSQPAYPLQLTRTDEKGPREPQAWPAHTTPNTLRLPTIVETSGNGSGRARGCSAPNLWP